MIRVGASAIGFVAGALNDCNRAKSPVTGRLQIPLVYFAPAAGIFYPIKTVYPTRRYVVPRRCTTATVYPTRSYVFIAMLYAAATFDMLCDKSKTVAKKKYMIF